MSDTIFALSTPPGKAGVAVIRLSGPDAHGAGCRLAGSLPKPRVAAVRNLTAEDETLIDQALVLYFEKGHSFTGEDVVEIQCHGSHAVIRAILSEIASFPNCRPAEAGEFSRRALEHDRLDIAQIEGLADLLEAETEIQRKIAMRVFDGRLGQLAEKWRSMLIDAAALVTVSIDFADEDVPEDMGEDVVSILSPMLDDLKAEVAGVDVAKRIREGFEVAIVGNPNVGKSTILNRLAGREVAITSRHAGTTRDVIELSYDLNGLPVTFLDTAGVREAGDEIEKIGIELTRRRAETADLRIVILDENGKGPDIDLTSDDYVVQGKVDLLSDGSPGISAVTGHGIDEMLHHVSEVLSKRILGSATATRERHKVSITSAIKSIEDALERLSDGANEPEFIAEDIRHASHALAQLTGRVDLEDMLDVIFSRFCIGK